MKKSDRKTSAYSAIIKFTESLRRRRTYLTVLSCLVVFITTYLLILPAVTLEQDEAEKQGGIDLPAQTQQEEMVEPEEQTETAEQAEPAEFISHTGKGYEVTVENNNLPADTELAVEEIQKKDTDYDAYYEDALKAVQSDGLAFAKFYDISLVSEGESIEPENPLNVKISFDKGPEASDAEHVRIVHFAVDEETGKADAEVLDPETVDTKIKSGKMKEASFAAESFSVYAVVYTVDFHWEVDGKKFEYSLPGGGYVGIEELMKLLGVVEGTDEAEQFAAKVERVEFSDPDLVWVGKADEETTVGALKETYELECQYSEELTEEDIAEINAQMVETGDWALISLHPFDTEETLTVTMENGDVFEVKVTDVSYQGTKTTDPNGKTVALLNLNNNNALQNTAHSTYGRLQATDIQVDGNRITSVDTLSTWTFTKVDGTNNQYYISSGDGYLNISNDNNGGIFVTSSPQALTVQTKSDGTIRIKHSNNNNAVNNYENHTSDGYTAYSSTWDANPGEWFTMYEVGEPIIPHVTVHYVKRDGTELPDVEYNGGNPLVVKNVDGTFTIPFDWGSGQTTDTSVDLRTQFSLEGYTYANTHLAGKDHDGNPLTYNGYVIDSTLTRSGSNLQFKSDSGATYAGLNNNPPKGNLAYGNLTSFSLSGNVSARPANNGSRITYATQGNKDIYVILDPVPGSSAASPNSNSSGIDAEPPILEKTMEPNNDGTYTLSLKVDAHAKGASGTNKANILFVVDTSSSMRNTTTSNDRNRIMDTHDAVLDLGEKLLDYNRNYPNSVEVSMITFDGGVAERLDWTDDKTTFQEKVNEYLRYYYLHTGTDWEDSLNDTLEKLNNDTDSDPTFVVFFTDGEPSQYTNFHGPGTNSHRDPTGHNTSGNEQVPADDSYGDFFSYFLSRESAKDEMRAIVNSGVYLYGIYAYNSTEDGYGGYNGKEDGAAMLHNAIKYGYNTNESLENNLFYEAKDTDDLKGAFDRIFNLITEKVGFSNVVVKDGIAAGVTSTTVVDGDVSGFTYIIRDKAGALAYKVTVAPNGVPDGQTVADGTPLFWLSDDGPPLVGEIKPIRTTKVKTDDDGNPVLDANDKIQTEDIEIDAYYYKDANDNEYIMPISTTGENIKWDLAPLGILKDGYSYEVNFVVWPNQEAYDLVADLNNGKRKDLEQNAHWEDQPLLTDSSGNQYRKGGFAEYPYISRYEQTGIYSAMSNTDQTVEYYKFDTKIEDGEEVTIITPGSKPVAPPDPMPLTASLSQIEKKWNIERDPGIFAQYLYNTDGTSKKFKVDFDVFQGDNLTDPYKTVSLGWDDDANNGQGAYVWAEGDTMVNVTYAGHQHQIGTCWANEFSIATGLMLSSGEMEKHGLNKSLYPSAEFDGETYYILEIGHDYTIKEHQVGTIGYEFDFSSPVYHPMLVDGVLKNVEIEYTKNEQGEIERATINSISNNQVGLSGLRLENTLRGYIHLNKVVVDAEDNRIDADNTKFEYTIQLNNTTDPGPFKGDHIPWYGISGLFYNDGHENYYQVYEDQNKVWKLKNEKGEVFDVTSSGFNENEVGAQTVTYRIDAEHEEEIVLYGNQMNALADGKTATAVMAITQFETLNIANVPVGTTYSIKESDAEKYDLVSIEREIKNGDVVESTYSVPNEVLPGREIEGTIAANRDNGITFKNRLKPGALKFRKIVQVDGKTPTSEQYEAVDGDYIFTVTSAEGNDFALEKYVQVTVSNGSAVSYKIADTRESLASAESVEGAWVVIKNLAEGDYIITETDERNGLLLTDIVRGDEESGAVDFDNSNVTVHVTMEDENASDTKAQATFTNNFFNNDGPDRITIDIEKTFEGLVSEEDIPKDFQVVISYTAGGSTTPLELTLVKDQNETVVVGGEHIKVKETSKGYKLSWHITNLPKDANHFKIKEVGYGSVDGYEFTSATLDEAPITETADQWHDVSVTAPTATLSDVTGQRKTSDSGQNLKFFLEENDILLSKLTANMGTMVITAKSLNTLEREAIKNGTGWPQQGGFSKEKITFFSLEEHSNGFQYGGKTVTFGEENGKVTVSFSHSASAQEYVYDVKYGTKTYLNNAALMNSYTQKLVTLELIKVDASDMETPLEHAQFTLEGLDPSGTGYYLTGDKAIEKTSNETGTDGIATISGIPNGYYEISENKVPAGYVLEGDGKFYIKVSQGIISRIIKTEDDPATEDVNEGLVKNWPVSNQNTGSVQYVGVRPATDSAEAVTTFKVGNTSGAALPSSGGPGTTWIYLLGSLLLLGSGIMLAARRRTGH